MKKNASIIALVILACAIGMSEAYAMTYMAPNGVEMGTICRNGALYTSYPPAMAQPVGTTCPIRDNFGNIIAQGVVTNE